MSGGQSTDRGTLARLRRVERIVRRTSADEYIIIERKRRRVNIEQRSQRRVHACDASEIEVELYFDLRRGRASATFVATEHNLVAIDAMAALAAARALHGQGPEWRLPPAASPARVPAADPAIVSDPESIGLAAIEQLIRAGTKRPRQSWSVASIAVEVEARQTTVLTSAPFVRTKIESFLELDAVIRANAPGLTGRLHQQVRSRADLAIRAGLPRTLQRLEQRAAATPAPRGQCDLVLGLDAITGRGVADRAPRYVWFCSFVLQADGQTQRRGLSRYSPGAAAYAGREVKGDKLTLLSDGTLPSGWYTTPFGERGEGVRRFILIKDGVADQLALDVREAGLRRTLANGGVRNLIVPAGRHEPAVLRASRGRPVIVVDELAMFDADPLTGDFSAELGLGHVDGKPVTGGHLRGNLFDLFADAAFGRETTHQAWYQGPREIRFNRVSVK